MNEDSQESRQLRINREHRLDRWETIRLVGPPLVVYCIGIAFIVFGVFGPFGPWHVPFIGFSLNYLLVGLLWALTRSLRFAIRTGLMYVGTRYRPAGVTWYSMVRDEIVEQRYHHRQMRQESLKHTLQFEVLYVGGMMALWIVLIPFGVIMRRQLDAG